jgi:hypothetical protein
MSAPQADATANVNATRPAPSCDRQCIFRQYGSWPGRRGAVFAHKKLRYSTKQRVCCAHTSSMARLHQISTL